MKKINLLILTIFTSVAAYSQCAIDTSVNVFKHFHYLGDKLPRGYVNVPYNSAKTFYVEFGNNIDLFYNVSEVDATFPFDTYQIKVSEFLRIDSVLTDVDELSVSFYLENGQPLALGETYYPASGQTNVRFCMNVNGTPTGVADDRFKLYITSSDTSGNYGKYNFETPIKIVSALVPEICLVTTNDDNQNEIQFYPITSTDIDYYKLYYSLSEGGALNFIDTIDNQPNNNLYIDTQNDPASAIYYYYLTSVDNNGVESDNSDEVNRNIRAKAQFVDSPPKIFLTWNKYITDLGSGGFLYNVYRGTDPNNLQLITPNPTSGIDNMPDQALLILPVVDSSYYRVQLVPPYTIDCTEQRSNGSNIYSNIVYFATTGIASQYSTQAQVAIFPNPANSYINITVTNPEYNSYTLTILDVLGREVLTKYMGKSHSITDVVSIENLAAGTYNVIVKSNTAFKNTKLIKY